MARHRSGADRRRSAPPHSVRFLNDLEANALGLATLALERLVTLNPGRAQPTGVQALIAPARA